MHRARAMISRSTSSRYRHCPDLLALLALLENLRFGMILLPLEHFVSHPSAAWQQRGEPGDPVPGEESRSSSSEFFERCKGQNTATRRGAFSLRSNVLTFALADLPLRFDGVDPGLRHSRTPLCFSPSSVTTTRNLHPNPRAHGAPRERRNVNPRPNRESTNRQNCEAGREGGGPCSLFHGRYRVRPRGNGTTRSDGCESVCVCVDRQRRQPC